MSDDTRKSVTRREKTSTAQEDDKKRTRGLNAMIVAGAAIIIVFGFSMHKFDALGLSAAFNYLGFNLQEHWKSWEFGALLWTLLFVFYYFLTVSLDVRKHQAMVRISLVLLGVFTVAAGWTLLYLKRPFLHVLSVAGVGLFLMSTDGLLAKYIGKKKEKKAFCDSFWIAGVPTVFAYIVLVVYLGIDILVHRHDKTELESPEIFMSGAISFQLLISNIIFVILQKGWLRKNDRAPRKTKPRPAGDKKAA